MVTTHYTGSKVDDDTEETSHGSIIAGGISGAVAVIILIAICIPLLTIAIYKRKSIHRNNQERCPVTYVVTQTLEPAHTEFKESNFMGSNSAPPPQVNVRYVSSHAMGASMITNDPAEYETAKPQKLAKQMEGKYYFDMNQESHCKYNTDEELPDYYGAATNYYDSAAENPVYPISLPSGINWKKMMLIIN